MARILYAVTAVIDGKPVGAFAVGHNPDEIASKSQARLGETGKITHIVPLCEANVGTLTRNRLLELCEKIDQIEFLAETMVEITDALIGQVATLRACLESMTSTLVDKLGLKQFGFTIVLVNTGVTQKHETFAPNLETAQKAALEFAVNEYGNQARLHSIKEIIR